MDEKTIIEVNGIKLEIDLRHAKRIDQFRIGDNIKVLVKEYDSYKSYPGVIIGFDEFKILPTIVICYLKTGYDPKVEFAFFNSEAKGLEIAHMNDADKLVDEDAATKYLDREIDRKRAELLDMELKKAYFSAHYNRTFKADKERV